MVGFGISKIPKKSSDDVFLGGLKSGFSSFSDITAHS